MRGLYAIADVDLLNTRGIDLRGFAVELHAAGVAAVQLRYKQGSAAQVLAAATILRDVFGPGEHPPLLMNDRVDLALLSGFDGAHLGQEDLRVDDARLVWSRAASRLPEQKHAIFGLSTHTDDQVRGAELSAADYLAVGPVFATGTKPDASPVVGLEGVRRARALTGKPLVAIGGITRGNARSVIDAGADCIAVISGLLAAGESVEKVARDFVDIFR